MSAHAGRQAHRSPLAVLLHPSHRSAWQPQHQRQIKHARVPTSCLLRESAQRDFENAGSSVQAAERFLSAASTALQKTGVPVMHASVCACWLLCYGEHVWGWPTPRHTPEPVQEVCQPITLTHLRHLEAETRIVLGRVVS